MQNPPALRTSRLFVQLIAILVPSFLLASGVALAFLSSRDATVFEDALSTRLGNLSARTAAALERHAGAEEGEERWSAVLPRELLSNLLADPAILCARLESATAILAEVPVGLGCARIDHDGVFAVPLEEADGAPLTLAIDYSRAEVTEARRLRREFSLILLGGALLIALAASWFAFRIIVGLPLKVLLKELLLARREIERSGRAKTEFLAAISHDIRTPLNGIIGLADELRRDVRSEEHRALINVICESGDMLIGLVNNFLDLSKIDSGQFELDDAPFLPSALVHQVEQMHGRAASAKGIRLTTRALGDFEQPIRGDPQRIRQILDILVGNAVKFTTEGAVTVTLDRRAPGILGLEVSDTGIGVAEAQLARIFDSYSQAERSTSCKYGGAGLGLAIVRRLVDSMKGEITVTSRPGEGATFRVTVPVQAATMPLSAAPNYEMLIRAAAGLRVLADDDVPTNRLVLERLLARMGVRATVVDSAEAALDLIGAAPFDLVLMDISMPGMSGVDAFRAIRAREASLGLDPTPMIATTANALRHQVDEYLALGFAGHLAKPIDLRALAAALARARPHPARPRILSEIPAPAKTSG